MNESLRSRIIGALALALVMFTPWLWRQFEADLNQIANHGDDDSARWGI